VPSEKNEERERERERERKREKQREKEKKRNDGKSPMPYRGALHSRASILSFGPVHRNLHGKLPRGRDERNVNE